MKLRTLAALFIVVFSVMEAIQVVVSPWWTATLLDRAFDHRQQHFIAAQKVNLAIDSILSDGLAQVAGANRLRLALISATPGDDGTLHFNVVHVVTAPGTTLDNALPTSMPMAQWAVYNVAFLRNECITGRLSDPDLDRATKTLMRAGDIAAFVGCPVFNKKMELLGALFVHWSHETDVPDDFQASIAVLRRVADRLPVWLPGI